MKRVKRDKSPFSREKWALSQVRTHDFMCYQGKLTIPLKPLVMLFGANNAGKTAVIKALQFAHFVAASNGEPFTLGGNLDALGSLQGLIHRRPQHDGSDSTSNGESMQVGARFTRVGSKPDELDRFLGTPSKKPVVSEIDIDWIVSEAQDGTLLAEVGCVNPSV